LGDGAQPVVVWVRLEQLAAGHDETLAGADHRGPGEQVVAQDRCEQVAGVAGGQHRRAGQRAGGEGEGVVGGIAEQPAVGEPVLLAVLGAGGTASSTSSGPKRLRRAPSRRLKGWAASAARAWSSDGGMASSTGAGLGP
jgi:hypothetical protein